MGSSCKTCKLLVEPNCYSELSFESVECKINDVTWKFLGATPEYITTKAATPAVVIPNFLNAEKLMANWL